MIPAEPVQVGEFDRAESRFVRSLSGKGQGPFLLEPDGPLFAHSRPGFSDLRILDARAREVAWRPVPEGHRATPVKWPLRLRSRAEVGSRTRLDVDLGFRNVEVDEIRISARTRRYDRPLTILGSNDGHRYVTVAKADLVRFGEASPPAVPVSAHFRHLRLKIENGDDPPLHGIRVSASGDRDALLIEGGHPRPYVALYGDSDRGAPDYDFARLPLPPAALRRATGARLGPERRNPAFEPTLRPDRRSFVARHQGFVAAALVVAALAVALAGALVLRSNRLSV